MQMISIAASNVNIMQRKSCMNLTEHMTSYNFIPADICKSMTLKRKVSQQIKNYK